MKFTATISLLAMILLGSTATALGQEKKSCLFDLVGTWKAQVSTTEALIYKFDANGGVTVLSVSGTAEPKEIATAKYEVLEDLGKPQSVSLTATGKTRIFGAAKKTMKVVSYDDSSITCQIPGVGLTRWTRVDPDRYFIVLAARQNEFYDFSGTAFSMVIKLAGGAPTINAFGIYAVKGVRAFGAVPADVYKNYLREPRSDSETTLLRLELNSRQYERASNIIKEWERRDREDALLYKTATETLDDATYLNNILVVKAVTETLNQCSEDFNLYPLNYVHKDDWISNKFKSAFVPFNYFKELRQRNEARHIPDQKFQELVQLPNVASR